MVAWIYFSRVESQNFIERYALHHEIINGTAGSPYRYRVLIPYLAEILVQLFTSAGIRQKSSFQAAYFIINIISIFSFLHLSYKFFRCFYSQNTALIGILFIGCMIHIGLQDHYYQPWSITEAVFFVAALLLLKRQQMKFLWPLVIVASLNRETAILIPALIFFHSGATPPKNQKFRQYKHFLYAFLAWLAAFAGLRHHHGFADHVISIHSLINLNLKPSQILKTALNAFLLLGGWWIILIHAVRKCNQNTFLSQSWLILIVYIPLVLVFGVWSEVRLLIPLYPLAIATCLIVFEDTSPGIEKASA